MADKKKTKKKASPKSRTITRVEKSKAAILSELEENGCNVHAACKKHNIGRRTFYEWTAADQDFADAYSDIQEQTVDGVESWLYSKIYDAERDSDQIRAAEIYLKARGKSRGYGVEKREQQHEGELNVNAKVEQVRFELPENNTGINSVSPTPPGWETATGGGLSS